MEFFKKLQLLKYDGKPLTGQRNFNARHLTDSKRSYSLACILRGEIRGERGKSLVFGKNRFKIMDKTRYQIEKLNHAQYADEEGSVCPGKILFRLEGPSQNEQELVENLSELC